MVSGTGRVTMTCRTRLRSRAFCWLAVSRPLAHHPGRARPTSRSCSFRRGSSGGGGGCRAKRSRRLARLDHRPQGHLPAPLQLRRHEPVVGVDGLVLPLGQAGLVFGPGHLVGVLLRQPGLLGPLGRQHVLQQVQLGRGQRFEEGWPPRPPPSSPRPPTGRWRPRRRRRARCRRSAAAACRPRAAGSRSARRRPARRGPPRPRAARRAPGGRRCWRCRPAGLGSP